MLFHFSTQYNELQRLYPYTSLVIGRISIQLAVHDATAPYQLPAAMQLPACFVSKRNRNPQHVNSYAPLRSNQDSPTDYDLHVLERVHNTANVVAVQTIRFIYESAIIEQIRASYSRSNI